MRLTARLHGMKGDSSQKKKPDDIPDIVRLLLFTSFPAVCAYPIFSSFANDAYIRFMP